MIRKVLFWSHLACGTIAAFGILAMSVTGVLLTYERQIKDLAARSAYIPQSQQIERLPLDDLRNRAVELNNAAANGAVVIDADPGAPVIFRAGRRGGMQLNPYTGEQMQPAAPWLDKIFSDITGFHRWFNFSAEDRAIPRTIIGISNLIFLFLILSGMYLWVPRILTWRVLRTRLFLRKGLKTTRARDFVWHHVFGIWAAAPLIVLVVSGSLFSYRWTGDLIFAAFGTERPAAPAGRGAAARGPGVAGAPAGGGRRVALRESAVDDSGEFLSLDEIFAVVSAHNVDWREISITLPRGRQPNASAIIDLGDGGQPQLRDTVTLDRRSGEVVEVQTFDSLPLNQRIRSTNRFLHTGQYFGLIGQTIAGLASAFAVVMVWTGTALAWRRLIGPLVGKPRFMDAGLAREISRTPIRKPFPKQEVKQRS